MEYCRVLRGYGEKEINNNQEPMQLMLRWRDDGDRTWGNVHYLDLGKIGDYSFYTLINRLGKYRMRQYELSITDDTPLIIASAEELVE